MSCKLDKDYIQQLLEGTLAPIEKIVVEEHIKTCKSCSRELAEMEKLFLEFEELREIDIDIPDEVSAVRQKIVDGIDSSSGGGDGTDSKGNGGVGGGSGIGARVSPTAILIIKGDKIELLPIKKCSGLEKLVDMVPEIVDKIKFEKEDKKQENKE